MDKRLRGSFDCSGYEAVGRGFESDRSDICEPMDRERGVVGMGEIAGIGSTGSESAGLTLVLSAPPRRCSTVGMISDRGPLSLRVGVVLTELVLMDFL